MGQGRKGCGMRGKSVRERRRGRKSWKRYERGRERERGGGKRYEGMKGKEEEGRVKIGRENER